MRQIIISDVHSNSNLFSIYEYIKKILFNVKIDSIMINGDILGIDNIRKGYGYNYDKSLFIESLDKEAMFKEIAPDSYVVIKNYVSMFKNGNLLDDNDLGKLGEAVCLFMQERYDFVIRVLKMFSGLKKTYFNIGVSESPLHYNVLKEISFLLDVKYEFIRKSILYTPYRDIYHKFMDKIKAMEGKDFVYLGGKALLDKRMILAGIPGLNTSSVPVDNASILQEKITKELVNSIKRQLSYTDRLVMYNQTMGKYTKRPFTFCPGSPVVRKFMQEIKDKLSLKVFVQSHVHWPTTHFYKRDGFYFVLNNAAVNNCIFNIVEISNKVRCYDVDPNLNKIRELKVYDSFLADYNSPEERMALNYNDYSEVIRERNIGGCYYS